MGLFRFKFQVSVSFFLVASMSLLVMFSNKRSNTSEFLSSIDNFKSFARHFIYESFVFFSYCIFGSICYWFYLNCFFESFHMRRDQLFEWDHLLIHFLCH